MDAQAVSKLKRVVTATPLMRRAGSWTQARGWHTLPMPEEQAAYSRAIKLGRRRSTRR